MPKVFVFTYDRPTTITTSGMLEQAGVEHTVLCHTEEARRRYVDAGRVREDRIVSVDAPKGLSHNRNAALEMMDDGEWAMFLVDDLKGVTELDSYDEELLDHVPVTFETWSAWQRRFSKPIDCATLLLRGEQSTRHADRLGAHLVGFAYTANASFRTKRWTYNTFCDGRAWMVKKSDLRFDTRVNCIDDLGWTAQNIRTFGVTVANMWVLPDCARYTSGGYGSIKDREDQKRAELAHLVATFPDLIAYKRKPGHAPGTHAVLRRRAPGRVR